MPRVIDIIPKTVAPTKGYAWVDVDGEFERIPVPLIIGKQGKDGKDGVDGINGIDGVGTNGLDGVNGSPGAVVAFYLQKNFGGF
jgi:hypothetical protein